MSLFPPTEEQEAILASAPLPESLMVSAYAGCGKTSTIVMLAAVLPQVPTLALAFNKKIAEELARVLPPFITVKTMNGLGHGAWFQACGKKLRLESNKIGQLITELGKEEGIKFEDDEWVSIKRLVNAARQAGWVPSNWPNNKSRLVPLEEEESFWRDLAEDNWIEGSNAALIDFAKEVLVRSIKAAQSGLIDFDDQIYMSTMFGGVYPRFPQVLVDEAQDLSPLNHLQLAKLKPSRLIVVGDPKQAIYAFRGASSESMGKIRALLPTWQDLPLTTTFRCPKEIVARQQEHAQGFRAAPQAPQGKVVDLRLEEKWEWDQVPKEGTLAVICRNNAPILGLAFKLIRQRIPIQVLGKDIGKGLIALLKKLCKEDSTPLAEIVVKVEEWMRREASLAEANKQEWKLELIYDKGESLLAVVDSLDGGTLADVKQAIIFLFEEAKGRVTLCTGHKAKGLEWDTVVHLDSWRVPSKFALDAAARGNLVPLEQDKNLKYVIETRAKSTLVLANLKEFQ